MIPQVSNNISGSHFVVVASSIKSSNSLEKFERDREIIANLRLLMIIRKILMEIFEKSRNPSAETNDC